jgi:hypothetical protein
MIKSLEVLCPKAFSCFSYLGKVFLLNQHRIPVTHGRRETHDYSPRILQEESVAVKTAAPFLCVFYIRGFPSQFGW